MALKEPVKARYRISDWKRAQKNDKLTSNLSKWSRTRIKDRREVEEDSYEIMSQFYKERKGLLYHTTYDVVACKRGDDEKILHKHNHFTAAISNGVAVQIVRSDGTSRNRQGATKSTEPI